MYCIGGHRPEGAQAGESGQEKRQADIQPCPTWGRPRGGQDACSYLHLTGDVWRPDGVTEPESTPDLTPCTHSASRVRGATLPVVGHRAGRGCVGAASPPVTPGLLPRLQVESGLDRSTVHVATLLDPAPAHPAPRPWRNARDPFCRGRCSKCLRRGGRGRGAKFIPWMKPRCAQQRREVWGRERPACCPPSPPLRTTILNSRTPPLQQGAWTLQRVGGTCLWSHRAVSPQPPHAGHLSRDVPEAGLIF